MSKYYIGGVATVAAFVGDEHVFTARTLTDSSIDISVSSEEIRGGQGAQLLGKFFHTTVFNLSITDALFDLKYIAGQTGATPSMNHATVWENLKLENIATSGTAATGEWVFFNTPQGTQPASLSFGGVEKTIVWCDQLDNGGYEVISDNSTVSGYKYKFKANSQAEADGFRSGTYCVSCPIDEDGTQITIDAMFYPGIFSLIMRAKLFAGDACKISDGKPVGEVVIEIPRFQLDGAINLAMAMASPATYALNGSALANGCSCGEEPWYAKITQVIFDAIPYDGYTGIVVDTDTLMTPGVQAGVYAFAIGKAPKALSASEYTCNNTSVINEAGYVQEISAATVINIAANGDGLNNQSAIYNESIVITAPKNNGTT